MERAKDLPQDIVYDILVRLPAKSLLRFKSVCKNWCNKISDPDFQEMNVRHSVSKIMLLYQFKDAESGDEYSTFKLEENGTRVKQLSFWHFKPTKDEIWIRVSSCKNLVLFENQEKRLFVYDCIARQKKQLPELKTGHSTWKSLVFDESRQKCKVIVIDYVLSNSLLKMCHIFTLNRYRKRWRSKTWRMSKPPIPQRLITFCPSVILNGVFYWMSQDCNEYFSSNNFRAFIQPMSIATEEFMETIEIPRNCKTSGGYNLEQDYHLIKTIGSLCLFYQVSRYELELWVLKDSVKNDWIRQHKIFLLSIVCKQPILKSFASPFRPILFAESCCNTTTHILVSYFGNLCWYNMENRELTLINVKTSYSDSYPEVLGYVWDCIGF